MREHLYEQQLQNKINQLSANLEPVAPEELPSLEPEPCILVDRQDDKTWLLKSRAPFGAYDPKRIVSETLPNGNLIISHEPDPVQKYNSYVLVGYSGEANDGENQAELHALGWADPAGVEAFTGEVPKDFMEKYTNRGYYPQSYSGVIKNEHIFMPQVIVEQAYGKEKKEAPGLILDEEFKRRFRPPHAVITGNLGDYLDPNTDFNFELTKAYRTSLASQDLNYYGFKLQGEFDVELLPLKDESNQFYRVNPETNNLERIVGLSGRVNFTGDKYLNCSIASAEFPQPGEDNRQSILRVAEFSHSGRGQGVRQMYGMDELINGGLIHPEHIVGEPIEPAEIFKTVFDDEFNREFMKLRNCFVPKDLVAEYASQVAVQSLCDWSDVLSGGPRIASVRSGIERVYKSLVDIEEYENKLAGVAAQSLD